MPKVTEYKKNKHGKNANEQTHAKHKDRGNKSHHVDSTLMPDNKNNKKAASKAKSRQHVDAEEMEDVEVEVISAKRRPGRDESIEYIDTLEGKEESEDADEDSHDHEDTTSSRGSQHHAKDEADDGDKVKLEFFGSEMIRAQIPEVFDAAESIATEWKKDGDFSDINIPNPILKTAASMGLQRAKKVEKKLEEKGVFLMAKMGAEFIKSKLKK